MHSQYVLISSFKVRNTITSTITVLSDIQLDLEVTVTLGHSTTSVQ